MDLHDDHNAVPLPPLWTPDKAHNTRIHDFIAFIQERTGELYTGYAQLHDWSIAHPEDFWESVWDFCGVIGDKGKIVFEKTPYVPWVKFFPDSRFNYAENILRHADTPDNQNAPAIIARTQGSADLTITWAQLYAHVSIWEQALRARGITKGDCVGVYLPNIPEAIIAFLACAAIGATFVSAGMEMGKDDLIERFSQASPKLLITADGYIHGEKHIARMDVICAVHSQISSIQATIILPLIGAAGDRLTNLDHLIRVDDFLSDISSQTITFERFEFNHPLYVLFSSGTSGAPKCFEHGAGGVLLKHLCEQQLNTDIRDGDRVFYHATPSWMMWNWLISALASGAAILLYDGSPTYPDAHAQWDFTATNNCTHHGTAAPIILSWAKANVRPAHCTDYDLSPLRAILSTGAVLPDQGFEYIHEHVKADVKISSIAGGTDIVGCFIGGNPLMPTYAGQINGPMLGMDVQVWDDQGARVKDCQSGELVCVNAFPSMPLRFLNDDDGEKYRNAYFNNFPARRVWVHGDTVHKTPQGQLVLVGRSDATLNQNGVRIGAASIYKQMAAFNNVITDAAAIDFIRPDNRQAITILFVVMTDGTDTVPDTLQAEIRNAIKNNITPYAIPTEIIAVPAILKTPNGKKAEIITKKLLAGKDISNPSLYGADLVDIYRDIGVMLMVKYRK